MLTPAEECEQLFLGSLLLPNQDELPRLVIQPFHFSAKKNGLIFRTFLKQLKNNEKPDIKTMSFDPDLSDPKIVGAAYISSLTTGISSSANISYYEDKIIKAWQIRTIENENEQFKEKLKAAAYTGDIEPLVNEHMGSLSGALTVSQGKHNRFSSWADYINECNSYDPSKDFRPSMLAGLRFPNGTLSYIGARPGGGKSTMLINIAREALATGRKVFLVNLEMVDRTVKTNFILSSIYSSATDEQRKELDSIDKPNIKYYSLFKHESDTRETFDYLRETAMKRMPLLMENNLFICDGAGEAIETIISEIKSRLTAGDVVLIDYVQHLSPPKNMNDQQYIKIKLISNALLTLALNEKLVIISGAQFGRQSKDNRGKEATLDDFREGGDIEQDAHNAIAIEKITDSEGTDTGRYIHVLKAREGGATYKRQKLNCNFDYLFIGGIEGEYNYIEQTAKTQNKKPATQGMQEQGEQKHQTIGGLNIK